MPTHAGSVAFRRTEHDVFFVIVTSSNGKHWVLPKGHIQPGESPAETALRELVEEAGVTGRIVDKLGREKYALEKEKVVADYFLVEASGCCQPEETRTVRWEKEEAALAILSFEDQKKVLRRGAATIRELRPAANT